METQPTIKRIYFDSNWLHGWPYVTNNLAFVLRTANWLHTDLHLPEIVEQELEEQFVRKVRVVREETNAGAKELAKLLRDIIDVEITIPHISDDALRGAFRARSQQLKEFFHISSIPAAEVPTQQFVDMAIKRQPPFEEVVVKDRTVVTGLQDTAILISVLAHLKTIVNNDRSAFGTSDGVFRRPEIRALVEKHGLTLEIFKNIDELGEDLFEHVWQAIRVEWDAEMRQVRNDLNANKDALAEQIRPLLPLAAIGGYRTIKELKTFRIETFSQVFTVLPEQDQRPPFASTYKRSEGSVVQIAANADVELDVKVQQYSLAAYLPNTTPQQKQNYAPPPLRGASAPLAALAATEIVDMTVDANLKLSITGQMRDGVVTDFKVVDVQVEKR